MGNIQIKPDTSTTCTSNRAIRGAAKSVNSPSIAPLISAEAWQGAFAAFPLRLLVSLSGIFGTLAHCMEWLLCREARNCFICQEQNLLGATFMVPLCCGSWCCFPTLQFHHFCLQQNILPVVVQLQWKLKSGNRKTVNSLLSHGRKVVGSIFPEWPGAVWVPSTVHRLPCTA